MILAIEDVPHEGMCLDLCLFGEVYVSFFLVLNYTTNNIFCELIKINFIHQCSYAPSCLTNLCKFHFRNCISAIIKVKGF